MKQSYPITLSFLLKAIGNFHDLEFQVHVVTGGKHNVPQAEEQI